MKMEESKSILSTSGLREADMEWQTFSLQELQDRYSKRLRDRPPYSSNELNVEPEKRVKKAPKSQTKATDCDETIKEKSRRKHADTERYRRYEHKKSLVFMYEHVSDYALETAGKKVNWTLNSAKAPTKDVILAACNIHVLMVERMIKLSQEQLAEKDRVIEQKNREIHVRDQKIRHLEYVLEECCEQIYSSTEARKNVIQRSAPFSQCSLPFRNYTHGQHHRIFFPEAEDRQLTSSAEDRNLPTVDPVQSSSHPSETFRNFVSGFTKRKWETVESDTTLGKPLPHDVPKRSLQHSPCSATSSRSSWCLVESSL